MSENSNPESITDLEKILGHIEKHDSYTRMHSERVGELMRIFAGAVHLPESHIELMEISGFLHDIGKLRIHEGILDKISHGLSLDDDEKDMMKLHVDSREILNGLGIDSSVVITAVRHHHECWDGSGYPDGLVGDEIPPAARMLAICDLFDAISEDRINHRGAGRKKAIKVLRDIEGVKTDPKLSEIFISNVLPGYKQSAFTRFLNSLIRFFT